MYNEDLDEPHFDQNPYFEGLILEVNSKKLKLDANNNVHVDLVRYCKKREAYSEAYSQWREKQGFSPSDGFAKEYAKEYEVSIEYSGTYSTTVMAVDEDDAETKATDKLEREGVYDFDVDHVEVSEA